MGRAVAVATDSTAYIPDSALNGLDIPVIPLWLICGDERYRDGVDIDPDTFYARLKKRDSILSTSQPSVGEFIDFYRQVAEEEQTSAIVGAYISNKISGTVPLPKRPQLRCLNSTSRSSTLTPHPWGSGLWPWPRRERRRQRDRQTTSSGQRSQRGTG